MPITFSKITNRTSRQGIILQGKEMAKRVIDAHLQTCGNNILQPSALDRIDLLSIMRGEGQSPLSVSLPSVPAASAWHLLEQRGTTNFLTLHQQAGRCLLEIKWLDQATQTACLTIINNSNKAIDTEESLANQYGWQRAIFDAILEMFFDPALTGDGKHSLDLNELLSPFPRLKGFAIADPLSLAKSLAKTYADLGPGSPKVAAHQTGDLYIKILFPLIDNKDFSVQQTMLVFYLIGHDNLDFAQGNVRAAAAQALISLCNLALGTQEGFRVQFNIEKGSDEQLLLIWQKDEMGLVEKVAKQIETAYRPWVRG